jgi:hypothetical protein
MAIICSTYLSTRDFSYNAKTQTFTAESSDLHGAKGPSRVYDDACDEGFILVSHITGDSIVFALQSIDYLGGSDDENKDIAGWNFKAVARNAARAGRWIESNDIPFKVLIIND